MLQFPASRLCKICFLYVRVVSFYPISLRFVFGVSNLSQELGSVSIYVACAGRFPILVPLIPKSLICFLHVCFLSRSHINFWSGYSNIRCDRSRHRIMNVIVSLLLLSFVFCLFPFLIFLFTSFFLMKVITYN